MSKQSRGKTCFWTVIILAAVVATRTRPERLQEAWDAGEHMLGVRTEQEQTLLFCISLCSRAGKEDREKIWNEQQVLLASHESWVPCTWHEGTPGSGCALAVTVPGNSAVYPRILLAPGVRVPLAQAASPCKGFSQQGQGEMESVDHHRDRDGIC